MKKFLIVSSIILVLCFCFLASDLLLPIRNTNQYNINQTQFVSSPMGVKKGKKSFTSAKTKYIGKKQKQCEPFDDYENFDTCRFFEDSTNNKECNNCNNCDYSIIDCVGSTTKLAENEEQTLKVLFNNKTFLLDLKKYEIYSPVHTTILETNKFFRHGTTLEKMSEIERLVNNGLTYKQAFMLVCKNINVDIDKIYNACNFDPLDATIKYVPTSKKFYFTKEQIGYLLNEEVIYKNILDAFKNNQKALTLKATKLEPKYKEAQLKLCTNKRGSFTTNYSSSTNERKHNIKLALQKFNGVTLMPGETISFNKTTGVRNENTGYKQAKIILNGAYTEGAGGGVCQASTTLYNACIVSDIEVLTSQPHSLPASYVKAGLDAMVSYGSSDLVIKNTTDGAITFEANIRDDSCTVNVYGLSMNGTTIEVIGEILKEYDALPSSTVSASETNIEKNTIIRPAFKGFEVQTYALYKKDNKIVKTKKIRLSRYKSQSEIIAV